MYTIKDKKQKKMKKVKERETWKTRFKRTILLLKKHSKF